MKLMKKNNTSTIMRGIGIVMTVGGAGALIGSTIFNSKSSIIKKSADKAIKAMSDFISGM